MAATHSQARDGDVMHQSVSITLASTVGVNLLQARGWTKLVDRPWTSPTGEAFWQLDEALMVALTAEGQS